MTAIVDAPAAPPPALPSRHSPRRAARVRWRFAGRLARREVRRRPGRTFLVMLLVAVPVFGMTVVSVLVRTNNDNASEQWARQYGQADLNYDGALRAGSRDAASLPSGARILTYRFNYLGLIARDGTARTAYVNDIDLRDPMTRGMVLVRSGRVPRRAGEVLVAPRLARAFGLELGDTIHFESPRWTERVVGFGVRAGDWNEAVMYLRGQELTSVPGVVPNNTAATLTAIDLPGRPGDRTLLRYQQPFFSRVSALQQGTQAQRAVNWTLVAGMVALAIVGVVIAGAFAVGARRQLVTLGQLSANGADERLLRRSLSLQGFWCGVLGSGVGFVGGVIALLAFHYRVSQLIHHDPGPYVWSVRDSIAVLVTGIVAATVAAFIPARSAARVPVLNALAGRRPLGTLPRRIVPVGLALFGGGIFVLVLVAQASRSGGGDGLALSAVFGGLLVLAGACCASSIVVAALAPIATRVRGAGRLAARSLVRSRARSAAVVMALAAVNAGAVAIATAIDSRTVSNERSIEFMPDNALVVSSSGPPSSALPYRPYLPLSPRLEAALRRVLPRAQWSQRRIVGGVDDGSLQDLSRAPKDPNAGPVFTGDTKPTRVFCTDLITVADRGALSLVRLSARDMAELQRVGAMALDVSRGDPAVGKRRTIDLQLGACPGSQTITAAIARDSVHGSAGVGGFLITPERATALKLKMRAGGVIIRNPTDFDETQRATIDVLSQTLFDQPDGESTMTNITWSGVHHDRVTPSQVRTIVLAIVLLIALIVLAMSLALSAAETRDERDVLVSLGARPSAMRAVAAWKAGLLAASGAIVAVPTGFLPVAVVVLAVVRNGEEAHVVFPWSSVLMLVLLAPCIAAVCSYVGSGIAQRVRPTRMSTFATD